MIVDGFVVVAPYAEDMLEGVNKEAAECTERISFTFGSITSMRLLVECGEAKAFQHYTSSYVALLLVNYLSIATSIIG
jgi:hypothetical protein